MRVWLPGLARVVATKLTQMGDLSLSQVGSLDFSTLKNIQVTNLTEAQLQAWMKDAGLQGRTRLSIYLPPHVFRLCNHAVARVLLRSSDAAFGVLPGLRRWAGVIVADGSKQARAPA